MPAADSPPQGHIFQEKQDLLKMSEISLLLDTYDDIFSDFDPRPYSERALSDDFLAEAKKAARMKTTGTIDLKFLIPKDKRNQEDEAIIKKRLHEHFRKHRRMLVEEVNSIRLRAAATILLGFVVMVTATYVDTLNSQEFLYKLLFVILEPTGWFMAWFGFDQIFYGLNQKRPDLDFYEKMSKCEIHYTSY